MKFLTQKGFTLVELMVVVAIIGILSSVAIPNFRKYQAKAKTSEAKLALSAIYMAETSFLADYDTYATCLGDMGTTAPERGYYIVGFRANNNPTRIAATTRGATCNISPTFFTPIDHLASGGTPPTNTNIPVAAMTNSTFTAGAAGRISTTSTRIDTWTINQDKQVRNTISGI